MLYLWLDNQPLWLYAAFFAVLLVGLWLAGKMVPEDK